MLDLNPYHDPANFLIAEIKARMAPFEPKDIKVEIWDEAFEDLWSVLITISFIQHTVFQRVISKLDYERLYDPAGMAQYLAEQAVGYFQTVNYVKPDSNIVLGDN